MARNPYYSGPPSDHFDGLRFFNPGQKSTDRSLRDLLRWQLGGGKSRWPGAVAIRPSVPQERREGLAVTIIGHASVLVQAAGLNLLIDPVWSERASPVAWAGPKRVTRPGVAFEDLPPIDAVLVTHNHYDHLDLKTLRRLQEVHRPRFVTALGNDAIIARGAPGAELVSLDWAESAELDGAVTVNAVPAHHWSARGRSDRRMALWCGFVIRTPAHLIYNVGDTGYGDGEIFREIRSRFGPPDVAIIPIGAYEPRWFMADQHVDPHEAVQIMVDCGAEQALGVHWGTFQLTGEARDAPCNELSRALLLRGMEASAFVALEPGDNWSPA